MASSVAEAAMEMLSPENWAKARFVLFGHDPEGFSKKRAASAVPVPAAYLDHWIRRSEEKRPEDEPWIHQIAMDFARCDAEVGAVAEDKLYAYGMIGVPTPIISGGKKSDEYYKPNPRALEKVLAAKNEKYAPKRAGDVNINFNLDGSQRYRKLLGAFRLAEAERRIAEERELLPLDFETV